VTFFRCLLLLSLVTFSAVVHAQDRASARALFDEGRALMRAGDYDSACRKLEASRDIVAGVGILFNLAECYEHLGRTASAWNLYRDVAAQLAEGGDRDRERVARDRADALEPKLSRVRIEAPEGIDGLVVRRDGSEVPASHYQQALPVDPGTHVFEAGAPGHSDWRREVEIAGGKQSIVRVELAKTSTTKPAPATTKPKAVARKQRPIPPLPPELQPRDEAHTARIVGWVFTIGGAAFTAVGFALYGAGSNQLSESNDRCGGDRSTCNDAEAVALGSDGLELQRAGLPIGIAGASALVAGIATLAIYAEDKKTEVSVSALPGGASLRLSW